MIKNLNDKEEQIIFSRDMFERQKPLFYGSPYQLRYTLDMEQTNFILTVNFYRTDAGT